MNLRWAMKAVPVEVRGIPPMPQKQRRGMDGAPGIWAALSAKLRSCPFRTSTMAAALAALVIAVCAPLPASAKDAPRSFSLSTSKTFAPGEGVKIQLFARNVPALEFRVYKVKDEEKFFASLKDLHSFGQANAASEEENIDEKTWLERIHDYKAHLWYLIRHFFRGQFTDDARDSFREDQGKLGKRSKVVGASEFAQVPLLNDSQLVARWKLVTPPALVSETQQLPVTGPNEAGLKAGVYLIEATDGTYKAYTVAIVTSIALVQRVIGGETHVYIGDREDGRSGGGCVGGRVGRREPAGAGDDGRGRNGRVEAGSCQAGSAAGERVCAGAARRGVSAGGALWR